MGSGKYTPHKYILLRERRLREYWTQRANEKNERIIGAGYAERQIAGTLALVEPIDVNIRENE